MGAFAFGSTVQEARSCPASKLAALLFPPGLWSGGSCASGTIQLSVGSEILEGLDQMA
jgi:hypothetical protein